MPLTPYERAFLLLKQIYEDGDFYASAIELKGEPRLDGEELEREIEAIIVAAEAYASTDTSAGTITTLLDVP